MISSKKNLKHLSATILSLAIVLSVFTPAEASSADKAFLDDIVESQPYAIVVTGADNIAAYKEAGIIKSYTPDSSKLQNIDVLKDADSISIMGTSIPTSPWDLGNNNYRNFTYSMSTYLYSNYKYMPDAYSLDIWHEITPDQPQKLKIQCYKSSDNSTWGKGFELEIDDVAYAGIATPLGYYYFKYSSIEGKTISGSGVVY